MVQHLQTLINLFTFVSKYERFTAMKNLINALSPEDAKKLLSDFMIIYFDKGFGLMNKTEIETLLYFVLRENNLLEGKCFNDSIKLKISEAKVRKLIYESQVKYENRNEDELNAFLRKSIGECLTHASFVKNNTEIRFAIEDKYLRVALHAKLRANHYFADTSFNKDIISLDERAFQEMVAILVPNYQKDIVKEKLKAIKIEEEADAKEYITNFIKEAIKQVSLAGIKQIGELLMG